MGDAVRARTHVVTLATIALATATFSARHLSLHREPLAIATSLNDDPSVCADGFHADLVQRRCMDYECLGADHWAWYDVTCRPPQSCVDREDDDHCFRALYRAQLEALEANRSYDELEAISPTGASFATPTVVRRPLGGTTY